MKRAQTQGQNQCFARSHSGGRARPRSSKAVMAWFQWLEASRGGCPCGSCVRQEGHGSIRWSRGVKYAQNQCFGSTRVLQGKGVPFPINKLTG
eukprot:6174435-Prymnesium_polylepis.1